MTGGLLQLNYIGNQDILLTGNPQITFFKSIYKKYTNFAKQMFQEKIEGNFINTPIIEKSYTIKRIGDLLQEVYIKLKIIITDILINIKIINSKIVINNSITILSTDKFYFTVDNIYTNIKSYFIYSLKYDPINYNYNLFNYETNELILIDNDLNMETTIYKQNISSDNNDLCTILEEVNIEIGGQIIDTQYGKWYNIYNQFFQKNFNHRFLMCNIKNDFLIQNNNGKRSNFIYIPLHFWFCKSSNLGLPLIAIKYNNIKLNLKLNNTNSNFKIDEIFLLNNFIFIDDTYRKQFNNTDQDILIEQTQYNNGELFIDKSTFLFEFNHPTKCLFWYMDNAIYSHCKLILNNHILFNNTIKYFNLIQPYESNLGHKYIINTQTNQWNKIYPHTSFANNFCMYSFCLNPLDHQPSGSLNFSKIDRAEFRFINIQKQLNEAKLHIFGINYNVLKIVNGMCGLLYSI